MPLDPSIPLQAKGVQLATPESQLNMMASAAKLNEYNRSVDEQNALRDLIKSGVDIKSPEARQKMYEISPEMGMKFEKSQAELNKSNLEGKKLGIEVNQKTFDLVKQKMADLAFNPSDNNVKAHLEDGVLRGEVTPQQAQMTWQAVAGMNGPQRKDYFTGLGMKAAERAQLEETKRGHNLTYGATIRGQNMQYDPTLQGNIAEQRKIGEARAETAVAPLKDARANLKALKTAGYDPLTGKDNVSALIKKSTSGAIETGLAGAYGAMPGAGATSGQEAIGKLASISKTLTLDLLDGKLGAGISNDDRTALEQRFGDMANSLVPADKRLAAWTEAKEIMRKAAMLPEPGEATASTNKGGSKPSLNDIFNPKK